MLVHMVSKVFLLSLGQLACFYVIFAIVAHFYAVFNMHIVIYFIEFKHDINVMRSGV